jgi:hypothetical protein
MKSKFVFGALALVCVAHWASPWAGSVAHAAPSFSTSFFKESELILKLTRLMETPAAQALLRGTPEGQAFARRIYGVSMHSSEELPYLARAWVDAKPPRRSLEDLYRSLQELRTFPADLIPTESLDLFAKRELTLAPGPEPRFLRFDGSSADSFRHPFLLGQEAFLSAGILPSEIGANCVADLLNRSNFVRQALLETAVGRRIVNAVFARVGEAVPAPSEIPAALSRILRQPGMEWAAIDLGDRAHDLVGLESHVRALGSQPGRQAVAEMLALDDRYAPELLVFRQLRATLP